MRIFLNLDGKERPYDSTAGAYMALVKKLNIRVADPEVSSHLSDANYPMVLGLYWEAKQQDPSITIRIQKSRSELDSERFILKIALEPLEFSARLWSYSEAAQKLKNDSASILRSLRAKLNTLYNAIEKYSSLITEKEYHAFESSHDCRVAKFIFPRYAEQERTADGTIIVFDTEQVTPLSELENEYDKTETTITAVKEMIEELNDPANPFDIALMSKRLNLGYSFIQVYGL